MNDGGFVYRPLDGRPLGPIELLELLGSLHPEWHERAACRNPDDPAAAAALMFPTSTRGRAIDYRAALAICATCTVKPQCAKAGRNETNGVWGGRVKDDRKVDTTALRIVAAEPDRWWDAYAVADRLGVTVRTAYRHFRAMARLGLVDTRQIDGRNHYRLKKDKHPCN